MAWRIANVIQAKRMEKLRIHHRYHMDCRSETSGLDFVFPRQHVRLFSRNVLDKLTQQRQGILQRFHIIDPLFF